MVIGIWSGDKKPTDVNEFLMPLAIEIEKLTRDGFFINGYHMEVVVRCFLADGPARSLIKGEFGSCIQSNTFTCMYLFRNCIFQPQIWMPEMFGCWRMERYRPSNMFPTI